MVALSTINLLVIPINGSIKLSELSTLFLTVHICNGSVSIFTHEENFWKIT